MWVRFMHNHLFKAEHPKNTLSPFGLNWHKAILHRVNISQKRWFKGSLSPACANNTV